MQRGVAQQVDGLGIGQARERRPNPFQGRRVTAEEGEILAMAFERGADHGADQCFGMVLEVR